MDTISVQTNSSQTDHLDLEYDESISQTSNEDKEFLDQEISEVVVVTQNVNSFSEIGDSDPTITKNAIKSPCLVTSSDEEPFQLLKNIEHGHALILTVPALNAENLSVEASHPVQINLEQSQQVDQNQSMDSSGGENDVNQAWFTSREDKTTFQNKGLIWKRGMFSKEETEILQSNITAYCEERNIDDPTTVIFGMMKEERKDFYRTIAKGLNRPLFSVYRRVIRMYDSKNHVGKYTAEELEKLKKLRAIHGNDWRAIGAALGRSASSIKDRCRLMKDNCHNGKWLPAEERRLADAVYELSNALPGEMVTTGLSWAAVAERVATRSEKQCRTKWLNYLNWREAGGTNWTKEDDITLIFAVFALGVDDENHINWNDLAKGWSSVRSPQWLRGKWWSLKRNVPDSQTMSFREICEYLLKHCAQKFKIKEDAISNGDSTIAVESSDSMKLPSRKCVKEKAVISITQPVLTSETSTEDLSQSSTSTVLNTTLDSNSDGMLEVITPGIPLTSHQTFLLTGSSQPGLPIATTLPNGQIIIQTVSAESLQNSENLLVHMNPAQQIIISDNSTLSSLASEQLNCDSAVVDMMKEEETYTSQDLQDPSSVDESDETAIVSNVKEANHIILSDPMLAGSPEPLGSTSDVETDKSHVVEDTLDVVEVGDT